MLRRLYDWTMDKASDPRAQWWLALFAFAESSFFPIPPHPLLGLMCLAEPKKALRFAAITTIASVAGGLFGYFIGYFLYESVGQWLIGILGFTEAFPKAACYLNDNAFWVIFTAAVTPVPFKLLTITAGVVKLPLLQFLAAAIAGRALIFMVVGILFRLFGAPIKAVIDKYFGLVTTAFLILLVGGFVIVTQFDRGVEESVDACVHATMAVFEAQ
ncbi:MAG: YqaA family protein [Sphingomonadaceae bacterium]